MRISILFFSSLLLMISGCDTVYLYQPYADIITVRHDWNYNYNHYCSHLSVYESDYQDVAYSPRPLPRSDYYELVDLAFGPGFEYVNDQSLKLWDMTPYPQDSRTELEFFMAFVNSLSRSADFYYRHTPNYPLEVMVERGTSSADLSALAAALLYQDGYDVGIAVFWNSCCPGPVHVAVAVTDMYPFAHAIDQFGTSWVFLETLASESVSPGNYPGWLNEFTDWLIWPLWEVNFDKKSPRIVNPVETSAESSS